MWQTMGFNDTSLRVIALWLLCVDMLVINHFPVRLFVLVLPAAVARHMPTNVGSSPLVATRLGGRLKPAVVGRRILL